MYTILLDCEGFVFPKKLIKHPDGTESMEPELVYRQMSYVHLSNYDIYGMKDIYNPEIIYLNLPQKKKRTVDFVRKNIHGLKLESSPPQRLSPSRRKHWLTKQELCDFLMDLHQENGGVFLYKGGLFEKNMLNKLNIPCEDIEQWGCPKASILKGLFPNVTCHFHNNQSVYSCINYHCSFLDVTYYYTYIHAIINRDILVADDLYDLINDNVYVYIEFLYYYTDTFFKQNILF